VTSSAASVSRLRRFLEARLDPSTFLGLHLTLSLVVVAAGVWLFSSLLDAVLDNAFLVRFDQLADRAIHSGTTAAGLVFFSNVSRVGSPPVMWTLGGIGAVFLILRRWPTLFVTWVAAFGGGGLIEQVLKRVVHRSRPPYGAAYLNGTSFSFPSGHSTMSFIGCTMLVYVIIVARRPSRPIRTALASAAAVFIILVGASRIYLGVHYPSDVLGGWVVSATWEAVCIGIAGVVLHRRGFTL
jgi:undecaprenyl-diphosphatase